MTLLWQTQQQRAGKAMQQATSGSIVGAPTLSAATVNKIFTQMGSPMVGTGSVVEQAARQTNIDDAFALGVWWTETNDGAAGVGSADRNPGSVRGSYGYPSAYDGYTIYPSYAAAINDWFNILKNRYVSRGLTSVYSLCYSYVGTSSAPLWAAKVVNLMYRYRGIAPPPEVTATATTPTQPQATATVISPQLPSKAVRAHQLARLMNLADNSMPPSKIDVIASTQRQEPSAQNTHTSDLPTSLPIPILPLVSIGLLAALAIALAGLAIGREKTVPTFAMATGRGESSPLRAAQGAPNTDALAAGLQFASSHTNAMPQYVQYTNYAPNLSYTPYIGYPPNLAKAPSVSNTPNVPYAPVTEALTPFTQEQEVPQLDFPSAPAIYQPALHQQFSPSTAQGNRQFTTLADSPAGAFGIPDRPTTPLPGVADSDNGSLVQRHGTTEALGRKMPRASLRRQGLQPLHPLPAVPESEVGQAAHSEASNERVPALVTSGRQGGLLRRYAQQ